MRILRLIIVAIGLVACGPDSRDGDFVETRLFAMGTWVDIVVGARGEPSDSDALTELESMLRRYETDYYAWADGELGRLNAHLREGRSAQVSAAMAELLGRAQDISLRSGGRFDPAVGGLVELWGFHSSLANPAQPSDEAIAHWREARPSIGQITLDGTSVNPDQPHLMLDLGGIAKGEIVDRLLTALRERGYSDVLVNAGGDLRAHGMRGGRSWRVGVQAPRGEGLLGTLSLASGEAVFTSGDYERFFDAQGQRMHHILDPTSGFPAAHTQAVTVIATQGALADAAATAIFVAGPAAWREVAAALDVDAVLRVDASGAIEMTDAMRARISFSDDVEPGLIVGRS